MGKIVWTTREIVEEMGQPRISNFPPLASITAPPRGTKHVQEILSVRGKIVHVIVYLPPGVYNLVWVSILLNNSRVSHHSLLRAVGGDNQYHSLLVADDVVEGDTVDVLVRNYDTKWPHTIGVRVEVEEAS